MSPATHVDVQNVIMESCQTYTLTINILITRKSLMKLFSNKLNEFSALKEFLHGLVVITDIFIKTEIGYCAIPLQSMTVTEHRHVE